MRVAVCLKLKIAKMHFQVGFCQYHTIAMRKNTIGFKLQKKALKFQWMTYKKCQWKFN